MNPTLAICVATYKRPEGLRLLLRSLARLHWPQGFRFELRIADNDDAPSAWAVLDREAHRLERNLSLAYIHTPVPNVARARNAAVNLGPAELVAFVDDDEVVTEGWLRELVRVHKASRADAVFGSVRPRLPERCPDWVQRGGFFDRPEPREGTVLDWRSTRTGNALVRGDWFYKRGFRFAETLGDGGEDSALFLDLQQAGARLIAAPTSIVYEDVPLDRTNSRWLTQRAYRCGRSYEMTRHKDPDSPPLILRAVKNGLLALALGLAGALLTPLGRRELGVRSQMAWALMRGQLAAPRLPTPRR
ncbi:MAG: glycosyltransferase family 2 protein [Planctomycetota bacterium]|jgi:succinoglycan biosynthesis protein ExoM